MLEETGLDIKIRHFLGLTTSIEDTAMPFMWEAVYVAYTNNPEKLRLSHEHLTAEWVTHIDNRLWHSTHQSHAQRALRFINEWC